jgi:hypothetical protein
MEKVNVYVGCGLTHAPQEYKNEIAALKDQLRKVDWITVLDFVTPHTLSTEWEKMDSRHIYHNDIHDCVGVAEAIIAELSYPSTGLGWELGTSVEKHKIRTMMCARDDAKISHLPIGASLHDDNAHVSFIRYDKSILELMPYFIRELDLLRDSAQKKPSGKSRGR